MKKPKLSKTEKKLPTVREPIRTLGPLEAERAVGGKLGPDSPWQN